MKKKLILFIFAITLFFIPSVCFADSKLECKYSSNNNDFYFTIKLDGTKFTTSELLLNNDACTGVIQNNCHIGDKVSEYYREIAMAKQPLIGGYIFSQEERMEYINKSKLYIGKIIVLEKNGSKYTKVVDPKLYTDYFVQNGSYLCPNNIQLLVGTIKTDLGTDNVYQLIVTNDGFDKKYCTNDSDFKCNDGVKFTLESTVSSSKYSNEIIDPGNILGSPSYGEIDWGDPVEENCDGIFGEEFLDFINDIFRWIQIIAPIIVIVLGSVEFVGAILQDDKDALKKASNKLIKRLIIAVVLFFIPFILQVILDIFNDVTGAFSSTCGIGE